MKKFALILAATAAALIGSTEASAANLITNGSFETGDLTGWTSNSSSGLNPFGTAYGRGMDGRYWHWLGGPFEHNVITTTQRVTGLTLGASYLLNFIMSSEFTANDSLNVSVNGGPKTLFTGVPYNPSGFNGGYWSDNWVAKSYNFTATSGTETVQFDTINVPTGAYEVGLDNVSLEAVSGAVPEPASWALMLTGFGLAGVAMRRRRSTKVQFA